MSPSHTQGDPAVCWHLEKEVVLQHPLHRHHQQIPQGESAIVSSLRTFLAGWKIGASWETHRHRAGGGQEAGEEG